MVEDNGGLHYTLEMFLKAEEARDKEKEQVLAESKALNYPRPL